MYPPCALQVATWTQLWPHSALDTCWAAGVEGQAAKCPPCALDSAVMPMPCPAGSKPDAALAKRDLFKKIINYMTIGIDMSSLFMQVMTAGMSNAEDVVLKKQLYLFICTYAV